MKIEVSIGEIVDKLSILQIKKEKISDSIKLKNIEKEYYYLYKIVFLKLKINIEDYNNLLRINNKLWRAEYEIRNKEKNNEFDSGFIKLSRMIYRTNDKRYKLKKKINRKYFSNFIEEKSH
jgi:hypothetical protein